MKILDLDMDYFMDSVAHTPDSVLARLSENDYGDSVWCERKVRGFLEGNLGLSKEKKLPGRIVRGHNEAITFWRELIGRGALSVPFDVVHVDSHADLGLGYSSWTYILNDLLSYPVEERPIHNKYIDCFGNWREESIGDYLLFAVAYQWISKIIYCANPNGEKNDYLWDILKNFEEQYIWDDPVENTIQLLYNPNMDFPRYDDYDHVKREYIAKSKADPEVPLIIIPTIEAVKFHGDFDYVVMAQSPNYTPASADFIIDVLKEYIDEI